MPNYILKELNGELTNGRKVVFPKMQTYSLHDYETVLEHMHTYAGNFSEEPKTKYRHVCRRANGKGAAPLAHHHAWQRLAQGMGATELNKKNRGDASRSMRPSQPKNNY